MCTRTAKKSRNRTRQRSVKGHRYSSRSQPPPLRRSIKIHPRSGHGGGNMQHAYSDPELRTTGRNEYERDFEYERYTDRRVHRTEGRSGSDRRREHFTNIIPPPHRGSNRYLPPYDDSNYCLEDGPTYTQTLNRAGRFSSRQKNRERMRDRHTVERERHLSRSKQHFDSLEDLDDLHGTKRAMSVRSVRTPNLRRDDIPRETREVRELNRLNSHQGMIRGKSVPNSNARTRAKSVDPRLSAAQFEDVNEEIVRKTPIISNRYAIVEMEHRESRNKNYLRSQSMPRSAFHKNTLNHHSSRNYDDIPNNVGNHHGNQRVPQPRRASLGRQTSLGPPLTNSRYGNQLELPEFKNHHKQRTKKGVSSKHHDIYDEDYDDAFFEDTEEYIHMNRRGGGDGREYDETEYYSPRSSSHRKRSPRKEKQGIYNILLCSVRALLIFYYYILLHPFKNACRHHHALCRQWVLLSRDKYDEGPVMTTMMILNMAMNGVTIMVTFHQKIDRYLYGCVYF